MESGREPSSSSQNSPGPRGLLYILFSVFGFLRRSFSRLHLQVTQIHVNPLRYSQETERQERESTPEIRLRAELHTPEDVEGQRTANENRSYRLQKLLTIGTWLAFLAAAVYGGITYRMWREMQNTNKAATDAFRIDERAWIEIETGKPELFMADRKYGTVFKCKIYPRNVGKTVATDIVVKVRAFGGDENFGSKAVEMSNTQDKLLLDKFTESGTTKPILVEPNPAPKVLGPGTTAAVPITIGCQEPQVFPNGHQMIDYVVGRIDYCDQFRVKHWRKFCFFLANRRGELWNCNEGNDADRNTEDKPSPECFSP